MIKYNIIVIKNNIIIIKSIIITANIKITLLKDINNIII